MPPMSSLRLHRLLLLASILIPAMVFVAAAAWNRIEVLRDGEEMVGRTANIIGEHASKVFDTVDLALGRVDDRIRGMSWEDISGPETSDFLRELNDRLPQTVSIWVTDAAGLVRAGSQPWDRGATIAEREWFMTQREGDRGTYVSAPFVGKATGAASFAVSRRRSSPDGRFDGIIHVSLNPGYFERFFAEVGTPKPHVASLIRKDGVILTRVPHLPEIKRGTPGSPIMAALAANPDGAALPVVSSFDGKEYFYAFRPVKPWPIFVGYGIERAEMIRHWHGHVAVYGFVAALSALTLFMVSLLALRRARAEQEALRLLREESEQRLLVEKRLLQSQKMESVGQLTGGIAHDFNNLLAVVMGNVELALKRVTDERAQRLLQGAMRGVERGASLTQRLLAFSRQQDLLPQSVNVPDLVGGMIDMLTRTIGPSIQIVTRFPDGLPTVKADPNQLELAVLNLVVNARDAMGEGGILTVTARAESRNENPLSILKPGHYVCISVTDSGIGMDEETLSKAVEPFFTTKGVGKGTGLGLSMVHGFAVQSGGALKLRSDRGSGTTAEIWLPQGDAEALPSLSEREGTAGDGLSVLFVDDDDLVLASTAAMLEDIGHEVVAVSSGEEALEVIRRGSRINIVVTDYAMPGMTGLQLAERVRRLRPTMPILMASGHAELPDDPGLDLPRLKKPFRQTDIAAAIDAVAGLRRADGGDAFRARRHGLRSAKD